MNLSQFSLGAPKLLARFQNHLPKLLLVLIGVLVPLLLFGALADEVAERDTIHFDDPTLQFLHARATPRFDTLMLLASRLGGLKVALPFIIGIALILWFTRQRSAALFLAVAVGGACAINVIAKLIFARHRPDLWVSIAPENDYGFPSGHSMLSMAIVSALLILVWQARGATWLKWAATFIGAAFVAWVGLSRLYLGVHYPSDVLAGWSASLAWVVGSFMLLKWPLRLKRSLN